MNESEVRALLEMIVEAHKRGWNAVWEIEHAQEMLDKEKNAPPSRPNSRPLEGKDERKQASQERVLPKVEAERQDSV
jgi:hypothetical protein